MLLCKKNVRCDILLLLYERVTEYRIKDANVSRMSEETQYYLDETGRIDGTEMEKPDSIYRSVLRVGSVALRVQ